jgi:hypothetical protein
MNEYELFYYHLTFELNFAFTLFTYLIHIFKKIIK